MARTDNFNNWATDVANSIREKTGKTDKILASEFDTEIKAIETEPNLQDKNMTIYENQTLNVIADEGYDGLNEVNVVIEVDSNNIPTTRDYLIKNGVEQTDFTGGHTYTRIDASGAYTEIQGDGYLLLAAKQWSACEWETVNKFNFKKYHTAYVDFSFPATPDIEKGYGAFKIYADEGGYASAENLIPNGRAGTERQTVKINIVSTEESNTFKILTGNLTNMTDYSKYGIQIYNLWFISDNDITEELTVQNEELTEQENSLQDIVEFLESKVEGEEGMGMRITKCDANGYPTELEIYGFEKIPNYYLDQNSYSNQLYRAFFRPTSLKIKEGIKEIGAYAFRYMGDGLTYVCETTLPNSLEKIGTSAFINTKVNIRELPPNLISIGQSAFQYSSVSFKRIPDGVTKLMRCTFQQAYEITQLSMKGIVEFDAISNGLCPFSITDNLKAIWIGSNVTNAGLPQYAFNMGNNKYVPKVFIDLPRSTIESFTYYQQGFCYSNEPEVARDRIICNDDEGWLTQDEFDAIDWATYTEEV